MQGTDNTAPTITGRSPSPNATNVPRDTNVQVQFSEPMNPATIDASSVHLRKQGSGTDVPATVSYAGTTATLDPNADLDPSAVYTVTVDGSVEDQAGNALGATDSWSFTTAALSFDFTDTTVSDFSAGTPGANTYVSETGNGEVILKPTEGQEFSGGPGLPAGWSSSTWESSGGGAGGTATVSGGSLHVDGALAGTDATFSPGHALEFVATFGATAFQHVGFGVDVNTSPNWAMFSTNNTADQLFARTNVGGTAVNTPIGSSNQYVGSPHLYRIEWDTTEIRYYVDGALVTTQAADFGTTQMRPLASDFNSGGPNLSVDWLHLSPYPASGTFDSRVFDAGAGQIADWGALSWNSATPSGTGIAISVRTGDTPTPDGTWSAFTPIASSGGDIPGSSRYVQYRAELSTTDPNLTPTLNDVTVNGAGDIPPTAVNDTKTVAQDSGATAIDVLANDTDPDGGPKTIASATQPAHGTVAVAPDNLSLTYTPNPDYCNSNPPASTDDFTYTLNGGSTATVAVTVTCAADIRRPRSTTPRRSPRARAPPRSTSWPTTPTPTAARRRSPRPPSRPTARSRSPPTTSSLTYTPNPNYCNSDPPASTDDFTYTLNGGSTATVAVTVTCARSRASPRPRSTTRRRSPQGSGATAIDVLWPTPPTPTAARRRSPRAPSRRHGTVAVAPDNLTLDLHPEPELLQQRPAGLHRGLHLAPCSAARPRPGGHGELRREPPDHHLASLRPTARPTSARSAVTYAVFNRAMDKPSAEAAFSLKRTSDGAAGERQLRLVRPNALIFKPDADLAPGTQYTASVSTAAKDLAGNPLAAAKTWQFTTANPPSVNSVSPADGATDVCSQCGDLCRLQQGDGQALRRGRLLAEANQRRGRR